MNCCTNCIGDRHLRKDIFISPGNEKGVCEYCGSVGQFVVDASLLKNSFVPLLDCYTDDPHGQPLAELFMDDWAMFSHENMTVERSKALLADIYDDNDLAQRKFSPIDNLGTSSLDIWDNFKKELMHENRFFPKEILDPERLAEWLYLLKYTSKDYLADGIHQWHRARIQKGGVDFTADKMGAPPKELASHGRANPAGIPYLYLASNDITAVSEIRPHTGEVVSVAQFSIHDDLEIIDLANPRKTVTPFQLAEESTLVSLRENIGFLEQLGNELKRPVLPHTAAIDYIPSQYLCEFVKKRGYDGVMYQSSVGDGVNIALFNTHDAIVGDVVRRTVSRVAVELGE